MNEVTLTELKIVVERALRPIRATMTRKRKMREELLAHLVAIFEEEAEKLGDEQTALEQAKQRFGDPRELTRQLQETVPRTDRFCHALDDGLRSQSGESMLQHAARVASLQFISMGLMMMLVLLVLLLRGRLYELRFVEFALLVAAVILCGGTFAIILLAQGMQKSLFHGSSTRSLPLAVVYGIFSVFVAPIGGLLLSWAATGDIAMGYAHFRFLCWFGILVPFLLIAGIRQMTNEARYKDEWANLKLEE